MQVDERVTAARAELDRTLSFFGRVEAKVTALFAINVGMIGIAAMNVKWANLKEWTVAVPAGVTIIGVAAGLGFLYRASFPSLDGGGGSLIYFREVAKRTEPNYVKAFGTQSQTDYADDLLGQVWRNAEILTEKFDQTKLAFITTALTLVPWTIFLTVTSIVNGSVPSVK